MSLVQLATNKDAVGFQKALVESIEAKVGTVLSETKAEIASTLLENPNGISSSAGGEKTKAEGGEVGKDRLPDTTNIKSSAGNSPPGGTKLAHVETKPGTSLAVNPTLPGKANEEVEKPAPHEQRGASKGKRALRMAMKKKYDKRTNESVEFPIEKIGEAVSIDEKVIAPGTVDHMAHAVHQAATGHVPVHSHRGTFTHFDHPHYSIHRDHGGINPDKAEHHYHVMGAGGHHKFSVSRSSKGVDVKHVSKLS